MWRVFPPLFIVGAYIILIICIFPCCVSNMIVHNFVKPRIFSLRIVNKTAQSWDPCIECTNIQVNKLDPFTV